MSHAELGLLLQIEPRPDSAVTFSWVLHESTMRKFTGASTAAQQIKPMPGDTHSIWALVPRRQQVQVLVAPFPILVPNVRGRGGDGIRSWGPDHMRQIWKRSLGSAQPSPGNGSHLQQMDYPVSLSLAFLLRLSTDSAYHHPPL